MNRTTLVSLLLVGLSGCGGQDSTLQSGPLLLPGQVAAVDGHALSSDDLKAGARSLGLTGLPLAEARLTLARYHVAAQAASPSLARVVERAALARALHELLLKEAAAQGPLSEEEQAAVQARAGTQLGTKASRRAVDVHFVVGPLEPDQVAEQESKRLVELARDAQSLDDVAAALQELRPQTPVVAYRRPPVTDEAEVLRLAPGDEVLEAPVAEVLSALAHRRTGDLVGPVAAADGFHVLFVLEDTPADILSPEERHRRLQLLVHSERTASRLAELRTRLKASVPVVRSEQAAGLLSRVWR